jgi:hypothetical protein
VSELVYLLDRLSNMKNELFVDQTASTLAIKVMETLIKVVSGPSILNQKLLGNWKRLYRILNYFIIQNLGNYSPITEERKSKIDLFFLSIVLIKQILK